MGKTAIAGESSVPIFERITLRGNDGARTFNPLRLEDLSRIGVERRINNHRRRQSGRWPARWLGNKAAGQLASNEELTRSLKLLTGIKAFKVAGTNQPVTSIFWKGMATRGDE